MKEDRKFLRKCVICGEYKQKEELIRITRDFKTSEIYINTQNKVFGRSVYVCKNENCINNLIKKKKTEHFLKAKLPENIKVQLATVLTN